MQPSSPTLSPSSYFSLKSVDEVSEALVLGRATMNVKREVHFVFSGAIEALYNKKKKEKLRIIE
jgi:fructose/tagatose bisphosphate aldolase